MRARARSGLTVWDSSIVLAKYLEREGHSAGRRGGLLRGKVVLELGSGAGHAGLIAALTGHPASVTLTDKHELLVSGLEAALLDNHLCSTCTATVYEWGTPSPLHERSFDLILAADCLYSEGTAGAFCDALELLVRDDGTRVLLCCEERWSLSECVQVRTFDGTAPRLAAPPLTSPHLT